MIEIEISPTEYPHRNLRLGVVASETLQAEPQGEGRAPAIRTQTRLGSHPGKLAKIEPAYVDKCITFSSFTGGARFGQDEYALPFVRPRVSGERGVRLAREQGARRHLHQVRQLRLCRPTLSGKVINVM